MVRWLAKIDRQTHLTATTALVVFVLLTGIYSLSYSGIFKSGDEILFVSGAVSLGGWGELSPTPKDLGSAEGGYVEPLNAVVGAGLYKLAELGKVGVVHTLYLTNVYVTALTAVVVLLIVRQRGYSVGVSTATALLFGLGTLAWPHATYYFRDPLAVLFVALALWSFERVFSRASWYGQAGQWLLTLGLIGIGILAKSTAAVAMPAFILAAVVRAVVNPLERRSVLVMGVVLALLVGVASVGVFRYLPVARLLTLVSGVLQGTVGASFGQAIVGAIISPGKGLFVESPVLLLALVAWPLATQRERLLHLTGWVTLAGLVVSLAEVRDNLWFGGPGWGVRHFLLIAPMLAAACAPALKAIWASRRRWVKLATGGLVVISVFIQLGAVLVDPGVYYGWLYQFGQVPWIGAIWNPLYSEALSYWRILFTGAATVDLAWFRIFPYHRLAVAGLVAAWVVLMAGALLAWRAVQKKASLKVVGIVAVLAGLALTVMPYGLLRAYYPDPYYSGTGRDDFRAAANLVMQSAQPGDVIIVRGVGDPIWKYMINYAYFPVAWYGYDAYAPNDTPSAAVFDEVPTTPWLKPATERLFTVVLPQKYAGLWQVYDQCLAWADLRLEERWLAKTYVAASSQLFQAQCSTRVSHFALAATPAQPPLALNFRFGDAIQLTSVARLAPANQSTLKPGDVLPLGLEWQLTQPVSVDYSIGVYLLDADGALKTQLDGSARGGFYPMTHWPVGAPVPDQHGLELPRDLPPGEYEAAVAVYNLQTGERLPVVGENGPMPDSLARVFKVQVSAR